MLTRDDAIRYFPDEYSVYHDWQIALVRVLDVPPDFSQIDTDEWRATLARATVEWGCDWLYHFVNKYGNVASEAVALLAERATQEGSG